MAYRFLIDGYNLLFALPEFPSGSWPEKRKSLLSYLLRRRPQGNNPSTVVFDSRKGLGDQMTEHDLTVIFTAGETADDHIADLVRDAANPRILIVVTDDLGIRDSIRGTGARVLPCRDFLQKGQSASADQHSRRFPDHSYITNELRKQWL